MSNRLQLTKSEIWMGLGCKFYMLRLYFCMYYVLKEWLLITCFYCLGKEVFLNSSVTPGSISLYLQNLWTALTVGALALINDKLTFSSNMCHGNFVFPGKYYKRKLLCVVFLNIRQYFPLWHSQRIKHNKSSSKYHLPLKNLFIF